ncbi:MAG: hypothetical protein RSB47_05790 [Ruthenibacterium sp.]
MPTETKPPVDEQPEKLSRKDLQPWQRRRLLTFVIPVVLLFAVYLGITATVLYKDRTSEDGSWFSTTTTDADVMAEADKIGANATEVTVGTYVEDLKDISLKNSSFSAVALVWFKWQGDETLDMLNNFHIYRGTISNREVIKNLHKDGMNYQLMRFTTTVSKNFWTRRFPLESHQLRFYIESSHPADTVRFVADKKDSGINPSLSFNGYELKRHLVNEYYIRYDNNHGDPEYTGSVITPELVTAIEIGRNSFGLYAKCFIALVGTIGWILITLYINTYHRVDPLGMIPGALFGTVSNIMVGANLLPDALQLGLLEYVNIFGIMVILVSALSIINVNFIRNKYSDRAFAQLFGRTMLGILLGFTVLGNVLLPMISYLR